MYSRLLVAIDGSTFGEKVFEHAVSLACRSDARLLLLHVLREESHFSLYQCETNLGIAATAAQTCLINLRAHGAVASASGAIADLRLLTGNPGEQICTAAQQWGADLILMGHQQFDQSEHPSVSLYVIHHAPCAVLVLPDLTNPAIAASLPVNWMMMPAPLDPSRMSSSPNPLAQRATSANPPVPLTNQALVREEQRA